MALIYGCHQPKHNLEKLHFNEEWSSILVQWSFQSDSIHLHFSRMRDLQLCFGHFLLRLCYQFSFPQNRGEFYTRDSIDTQRGAEWTRSLYSCLWERGHVRSTHTLAVMLLKRGFRTLTKYTAHCMKWQKAWRERRRGDLFWFPIRNGISAARSRCCCCCFCSLTLFKWKIITPEIRSLE